jgi:hypothetical protein
VPSQVDGTAGAIVFGAGAKVSVRLQLVPLRPKVAIGASVPATVRPPIHRRTGIFRGGHMTCAHCNAAEQRGRYCVGCGKLLPPSLLPARRVRLAPRPDVNDDDTQPVLRFPVAPRMPMRAEQAPAAV